MSNQKGDGRGWWLRALAIVVARVPWRALAVPGAVLGWVAGTVLRLRRAHVEEAMRAGGIEAPSREARAMYAALGRSAFEFLWLSRRGDEAVQHVVVDPASASLWRAVLAEGRGAVLAASHTGNWDLAASATARGVELLVVTKHLSAPSLDRFWQSTRARVGVRLARGEGALAAGRNVLRRGGAVAMMIDQVPALPRHALPIEFLGRTALADRAPAALAAASGSPLVVVAGRRGPRGGHVVHVLEVIRPPTRPGRRGSTWVAEATAASSQALEAFVRAYPSQWLWMHRRWKSVEVDPRDRTSTLGPRWSKFRSRTHSSLPGAASRAG